MSTSFDTCFFSQLDWLMPTLAGAEALRRSGDRTGAEKDVIKVLRRNLQKAMPELPRLDLCGDLQAQADSLLDRRVILLNKEVQLEDPVDWSKLGETDGQRNWHLGYSYWLNALADTYQRTGDERYSTQWRAYVEEFLDHCPYAADARGYWPTRPMVHNDLQTCNLGENGGPLQKNAGPESRSQWMSLSCHFRIETWLSNLARLAESKALDDAFFVRVLYSLVNDHAYVCVMNPRENTPNQFTAVTLSLLKLSLLLPECRPCAGYFLIAWERLQRVFSNNLLPDGSDVEQSPDYNCFLLDLSFELLHLLQDAPKSRKEIVLEPARQRLRFLTGILAPDGTLPPIAKGHAEDKREHFLKLAGFLEEDSAFKALKHKEGPLRESIAFPYGGYYCVRDADSQLLFKASAIGSGHMHEDCLGFLLWHKGKELLTDPSHYTYNTDTREEALLNAWALSTSAHNSICIDGHSQNRMTVRKGWPRKDEEVPWIRASEQNILPFRACASEAFAFLEGCYADGFGANASIRIGHARSLICISGQGWLVLDRLSGKTTDKVAHQHWHLSSSFKESDAVLVSQRELVTKRGAGTNLRMLRLDAIEPEPRILCGSMDPVGGWVFPAYGQKQPALELVWESAIEDNAFIATWIEPFCDISAKETYPPVCKDESVSWSTMEGIPMHLSFDKTEGRLQVGNASELRWEIALGQRLPLPTIPTQQTF